mgnify:CR=1 FL=1
MPLRGNRDCGSPVSLSRCSKKLYEKVNPWPLSCTVRDPKVPHFFQQKTSKKWDTLGTFTQKVPFLDYNKTKKEKSGTLWGQFYFPDTDIFDIYRSLNLVNSRP